MTIGQAIRTLRMEQHLSQHELAKAAGTTQTTISLIEKGQRPNAKNLASISKALKVPEPLLLLMTLERKDIPAAGRTLYDHLFPVIKTLVMEMTGRKRKQKTPRR